MNTILISATLALAITNSIQTQPTDQNAKSKEAMNKLSWVTGDWKGTGRMSMGTGTPRESQMTENIQYKLDGTLLCIEGKSVSNVSGRNQTVDTFSVISYNPSIGKYEITTWLEDGRRSNNAWISMVGDRGFDWGYDQANGMGKTRYKMRINDKGQWTEKGEMSSDGTTYTEFFDRTLDPIKAN